MQLGQEIVGMSWKDLLAQESFEDIKALATTYVESAREELGWMDVRINPENLSKRAVKAVLMLTGFISDEDL